MNDWPLNKKNFFIALCAAFLVCFIWWGYLFFTAEMQISCDAGAYERLATVIKDQGWREYFRSGPNREPFYPFLISVSMRLGDFFHCPYQLIQEFFQFGILFLTQILMVLLLRRLNVRYGICILAVICFGLSPAMINSALSLFSEILTYPWVLLIVLCFSHMADGFPNKSWVRNLSMAAILAVLFLVVTFVKGIFECITLVMAAFFILIAFVNLYQRRGSVFLRIIVCTCVFVLVYFLPLHEYKLQNKKYNGTYVFTDRGHWALCGNIARRAEPLNTQSFLAAIAYIPGEGVCQRLFGKDTCFFWSFQTSDRISYQKTVELTADNPSNEELNRRFLQLSKDNVLKRPIQFVFLTFLEGFKMFFWESTNIGFVQYPAWLSGVYRHPLLKDLLRGFVSLLTMGGVFFVFGFVWKKKKEIFLFQNREASTFFFILLLFFLFTVFYSLFTILTRYAFPIVPLYFVCIAFMMDQLIRKI